MKQIYLDYAAITPVAKEVEKRMQAVQRKFYGNPSSLHAKGLEAKKILNESRQTVAGVLQCKANEIVFCGSGTESANLAVLGVMRKASAGAHMITTAIEHHAVLHPAQQLEREGSKVSYIPVDANGIVSVKDVIAAIRPETVLISVMYANNEIGTIQPIAAIGKELKKINRTRVAENLPPVLFHSDACQAGGFLDLDVNHLGVDLFTLNGSKIYGPRGCGVLFVRNGISLEPLVYGGGQERGLRSGTEDVAAAAGFALALELADAHKEKEFLRQAKLRTYFLEKLQKTIPNVVINGPGGDQRLPNNINISIADTEGESLVIYLSAQGVYCSTGSACSTAFTEPSHVILAIGGGSLERAKNSLRFSLGHETKKSEIDATVKILARACEQMRYTVQA